MKLICLQSFLLLALLGVACSPETTVSTPLSPDHFLPLQIESKEIQVQLALNDGERNKGLMHRDSLDTDHGMLFVFEQPSNRSFWMRNTRIPLDIGYFDDQGQLLEVHALYPFDESPVPSRSRRVQFALEMNQGWFEKNQIKPGAHLNLSSVTAGIEARGFSPDLFQLP